MNRGMAFTGNRKRQVLVVDDEHINREMLGYIISTVYDVVYAENGQEALDKVTSSFEAILAGEDGDTNGSEGDRCS